MRACRGSRMWGSTWIGNIFPVKRGAQEQSVMKTALTLACFYKICRQFEWNLLLVLGMYSAIATGYEMSGRSFAERITCTQHELGAVRPAGGASFRFRSLLSVNFPSKIILGCCWPDAWVAVSFLSGAACE